MTNDHFSILTYKLCCCRVLKNYLMFSKFYTHFLLKMRMSSKYTTTKEFVNSHNISSIILMNVSKELVNPKGMTSHSKVPSLDLKVIFHTLVHSIDLLTLWEPNCVGAKEGWHM